MIDVTNNRCARWKVLIEREFCKIEVLYLHSIIFSPSGIVVCVSILEKIEYISRCGSYLGNRFPWFLKTKVN